MDSLPIYVVSLVGVLVPVAYVLFVVFLTRRGKQFSEMDGLVQRLQHSLHASFMARQSDKPHS